MNGTWRTTSSPARAMLGGVPTGGVVVLGGVALLALVRLDPAGFALAAGEVFGVFVAVPAVTVAAIRRARRRAIEAPVLVTATPVGLCAYCGTASSYAIERNGSRLVLCRRHQGLVEAIPAELEARYHA